MLGCGTLISGLIGALAIEKLARIPAKAEIASEFRHRNPVIDPKSCSLRLHNQVKHQTHWGLKESKSKEVKRQESSMLLVLVSPEMWTRCLYPFWTRMAALPQSFSICWPLCICFPCRPYDDSNASQVQNMREVFKYQTWSKPIFNPIDIDQLVKWVIEAKTVFFFRQIFSLVAQKVL